jgi:hypothetical protein
LFWIGRHIGCGLLSEIVRRPLMIMASIDLTAHLCALQNEVSFGRIGAPR